MLKKNNFSDLRKVYWDVFPLLNLNRVLAFESSSRSLLTSKFLELGLPGYVEISQCANQSIDYGNLHFSNVMQCKNIFVGDALESAVSRALLARIEFLASFDH